MIFVTGATGLAGSDLVIELARRHDPVRIAFHQTGVELYEPEAETVVVRYDDRQNLEPAMRGCRALFLLTPFGPNQVAQETTLIDAAVAAGVEHIVKQSVLGVEFESGFALAARHREIEAHLRATGVSHTILRPAPFFQDFAYHHGGTIRREGVIYRPAGEIAPAYVDARDVAKAALAALLDTARHAGRTYRLTGPEALSNRDVATTLSDILERPIRVEEVGEDAYREFLRRHEVDDHTIDALLEIHEICVEGEAGAVRDDLEGLLGREPTSFETFVADFRTAFEPEEEPRGAARAEGEAPGRTR